MTDETKLKVRVLLANLLTNSEYLKDNPEMCYKTNYEDLIDEIKDVLGLLEEPHPDQVRMDWLEQNFSSISNLKANSITYFDMNNDVTSVERWFGVRDEVDEFLKD